MNGLIKTDLGHQFHTTHDTYYVGSALVKMTMVFKGKNEIRPLGEHVVTNLSKNMRGSKIGITVYNFF